MDVVDTWPVGARSRRARAGAIVLESPCLPGDSGGPVVSLGGRLLAITVGGVGTQGTCAVAPDWGWIRELIEADRRTAR
jgi:hypothetical protein